MSTENQEPLARPRTKHWTAPAILRRVARTTVAGDDNPHHFIEARWPVTLVVILAVGLSSTLSEQLTVGPSWLAPAIVLALLLPLLLSEPHWHHDAGWPWQRVVSLLMLAVLNVANLASLLLLVDLILTGGKATGTVLALEAGKIWLVNVLVFGIWYWEIDRGGPRARHWRDNRPPDLLFPQMTSPDLAPGGWMPTFFDYLYVAFTNATAFSPTDTLPLSPGVKMLMLVQSLISLITVALVAARAVNILT